MSDEWVRVVLCIIWFRLTFEALKLLIEGLQ